MGGPEDLGGEFRQRVPLPRDVDSIQSDAWQQYYDVPGWRVWVQGMWAASSPDYLAALAAAETKPLALRCIPSDKGKADQLYLLLLGRYNEEAQIPLLYAINSIGDNPSFLLEPLTEREAREIDEQGHPSGPLTPLKELLRPEDLKRIFGPQEQK